MDDEDSISENFSTMEKDLEPSSTSRKGYPPTLSELVTVKCEPDLPVGEDEDDERDNVDMAADEDKFQEARNGIHPSSMKNESESMCSGSDITSKSDYSSTSVSIQPPIILEAGDDTKDELITGTDSQNKIQLEDPNDLVERDPLCPLCSDTFTCPQHQSKTQRENAEKSIKKKEFKCEYCSKVFGRRGNLNTHVRIHTGEKRYKCGVCERMFTHQATLKTHLVTHTGEKRFECSICFKTFAHRGTLEGHMYTHTGQKKFTCSLCPKQFARRSHVKAHLLTHSREKSYHCTVCGKEFGRRGNLKVHMDTHSGMKRFKCTMCSKEFTQQGSLKSHMQIHSGEKNYKCNICEKEFIQQSTLTKHMLTHTGERRFSCNLCLKTFTQKGTLTRHLEFHIKMDASNIDEASLDSNYMPCPSDNELSSQDGIPNQSESVDHDC